MIRILASFVAFLAVSAFGEEPEGCQLCRENVEKLGNYALSYETAQEYFLIEKVCKNGDFEVGGCSVGVVNWWSTIANNIFQDPQYFRGICRHIRHFPQIIFIAINSQRWRCIFVQY